MNFLDTFKENQTPIYRLYLEPGIIFIPGSSTFTKSDSQTLKGDCESFSVYPYNTKLYKAEISKDSTDTNLEPQYQSIRIRFYEKISNSASWGNPIETTDYQKIIDNDTLYFSYVDGANTTITITLKADIDSEYTQGDSWIFTGRERLEITPYLETCNQISFQGQDEYFQGTYLGNSLQFTLLKSLNIAGFEDKSFNTDTVNNLFYTFGWGKEGYRSKFTLYTGVKEGNVEDIEIAFIGYLEDIKSHRDIISINVGDGLYKAKETYGDNIGKVVKKDNLRSSRITALAYTDEALRREYEDVSYKHDKKYDVIHKPLSKNYPKEEVSYSPTKASLDKYNAGTGKLVEAEIVNIINYTGEINYGQVIVNHDSGIIEFEVSPLEDPYGAIFFTYKHCYRYKSPSFLAKKAFERLGYKIDDDNFPRELIELDKKVFTSFGRITAGVEDYRTDIPLSITYSANRKEFYFGMASKIIVSSKVTSAEKVIIDLKDFDPISSGDKIKKIYKLFCYEDTTQTSANTYIVALCLADKGDGDGLRENVFGKFPSKTRIVKIKYDGSDLGTPTTDISNSVERVFETPDAYVGEMLKGPSNDSEHYRIQSWYSVMGSTQNKEYANGSFLDIENSGINNTAYLYFNFQFHYAKTGEGMTFRTWDQNNHVWEWNSTDSYRAYNYLYKINVSTPTDFRMEISNNGTNYNITGGGTGGNVYIATTEAVGVNSGNKVFIAGTGWWDGVKEISVSGGTNSYFEIDESFSDVVSYNANMLTGHVGSNPQVLRHEDLLLVNFLDIQGGEYGNPTHLGDSTKLDFHTENNPNPNLNLNEGIGNYWDLATHGQETLNIDASTYLKSGGNLKNETSDNPTYKSQQRQIYASFPLYYGYYGNNTYGTRTDLSDFYIGNDHAYLMDVIRGWDFPGGLIARSSDGYYGDPDNESGNTLYLRIRKYSLSSFSTPVYTILRRFQHLLKTDTSDSTQFILPDNKYIPKYYSDMLDDNNELPSHRPFIPLDIWGICCNEIDTNVELITFCVHWIPTTGLLTQINTDDKHFNSTADFKTICAVRIDTTDTSNHVMDLKWSGTDKKYASHSANTALTNNANLNDSTNNSMASMIPNHKITDSETNKNIAHVTPHFFVQRNIVEGTEKYKVKTDWHLSNIDNSDKSNKFFRNLSFGDSEIQDPSMKTASIRGIGEQSVFPKFPFIYNDEIVYMGGNFGKYSTNSDMALEFSTATNTKYVAGMGSSEVTNSGILEHNNPKVDFIVEPRGYSENSHGRLISFSYDPNVGIGNFIWKYLGYTNGNHSQNIYKDFISPVVKDDNYDIHFLVGRSYRDASKIIQQDSTDKGEATTISAYVNLRGTWATEDELNKQILEDLENFQWVQHSKTLATVVPLANFNDKPIFNILSDLAKIQDYEFGIINDSPYFKSKSASNLAYGYPSWTTSTSTLERWIADGGSDENFILDGSGNNKYWIIDKEIFKTSGINSSDNNYYDIERALFGSTIATHNNRSAIHELNLLANDQNILNIADNSLKYHSIFNKVILNYTYDSYSLGTSFNYQIIKESPSQKVFERDLEVSIEYINDRYIADRIASRYRSLATQNRKEIQIKLKYAPFLKNGNVMVVKNKDYNIDYEQYRISKVVHNLRDFATDIVAIQELNPLMIVT